MDFALQAFELRKTDIVADGSLVNAESSGLLLQYRI